MKAKTTVLKLHSELSEQGHRLDSPGAADLQPTAHACAQAALRGAKVSLHTGDTVESVQDRATAHLTSQRVFKISQLLQVP